MASVEADKPGRLSWGSVALYALLIGTGIASFYLVRYLGRKLEQPPVIGGVAG